jgi:hypothetical protein
MTSKSWLWIVIACLIAIGVYVLVTVVDPIDLIVFGGPAVLLSAWWILSTYFSTRCPKCGERWGMQTTYIHMEKSSFGDRWADQSCRNCAYERKVRIPWYRRNA